MIRWLLERLIPPLNRAVSPSSMVRPAEEQGEIDLQTRQLTLYETPTCPYCSKVWRTIKRLNLNIESRDISRHSHWRSELKNEGGKIQVPCLRIAEGDGVVRWMYESTDIVGYLTERFSRLPEK